MRFLLTLFVVTCTSFASAQQPTLRVDDLGGAIPDYVPNQETFTRMVSFELDQKQFDNFGVQHGVGPFPVQMTRLEERDLGKALWNSGYIHKTHVDGRHRFRIFLRERIQKGLSVRLGRVLYDIPQAPGYRGEIRSSGIAAPPIPWDKLHAARTTFFSETVKVRIMQASVRVGLASGLAAGTVLEPPDIFRDKLDPGELLILCSGHQIPDNERHKEIIVDVPVLKGLTSVGFERLQGTYLVSSEESGIGGDEYGDCGWVKFRPGNRIPPQIPLAGTHRWYSSRQQLMQVGCPKGELPQWRMTRAVSARRSYLAGRFDLELPSAKGYSGGGLFDADGFHVGVLVLSTTGNNHSYEFGHDLVDFIGKNGYQRSGHVSGAWHPQTAIDVARRFYAHVPELREEQFARAARDVFATLPADKRQDAEQKFNELLLMIEDAQ